MKSRVEKGFDFLAPWYDDLARFFVGKDIVRAQLQFLKSFKDCKQLLILGGGSGWILEPLCTACPDLQIDYIDISPGMINAAKKNSGNHRRVNFIQGTESDIPNRLYDGVITNFYLDLFDEQNAGHVISKIRVSLHPSALWHVTDFVQEQVWHKVMLWVMYRFFSIATRIEAIRLPDWQRKMTQAGLTLLESKNFRNGFIKSNLYCVTVL